MAKRTITKRDLAEREEADVTAGARCACRGKRIGGRATADQVRETLNKMFGYWTNLELILTRRSVVL